MGAFGIVFTIAVVVEALDVQPSTVAVTLYTPAIAVVAPERVGFCSLLVKLFGPVHE